ncbi:MAG: ribonuclease P protein component [Gammaproteobacteria bacterium]
MPRAGPVSPSDPGSSFTDDAPQTLAGSTPQQTFPRALRLLTAAEFANVFQNGQRTADSCFTILFHDSGHSTPRLGFAISKQRVRLAVGRNRLRRLVRESFRRRTTQLPPVDMVVLARDGARAASNRDILASLERHWTRVAGTSRSATANTGTTTTRGNSPS